MSRLFISYLVLIAISLSFLYSYKVIRLGRVETASTEARLEAKRELGIFFLSCAISALYAFTILFVSVFFHDIAAWVVLTPIVYLILWSLLRILIRFR